MKINPKPLGWYDYLKLSLIIFVFIFTLTGLGVICQLRQQGGSERNPDHGRQEKPVTQD